MSDDGYRNIPDDELAAIAKSCDVHRQSLMRRIDAVTDETGRRVMSDEIDACDRASTKAKAEQRRRLHAA